MSKRKDWDTEDLRALLYVHPVDEAACFLGVHAQTLYRWAKNAGIELPKRTPPQSQPQRDVEALRRRLAKLGGNRAALAAELGISRQRIYQLLKEKPE